MLDGIDFSFGSGVTTAQIKAAGYSFVCRYLSGGNSKDINSAELANYKAAGIPVVFVFETTGTDATSAANGVADAAKAQAELVTLSAGIKDTSVLTAPVFFAVDEESASDVVGYLSGAASILGMSRVGVYGGLGTIQQAFNAGACTYGWQTYAWSNGQWDDRAILRQVMNGIKVGPCTADHDQAAYWSATTPVLDLTCDFGQWPKPSKPAPAPAPKPAPPAPKPAPAPADPELQSGATGAAVKTLQTDLNNHGASPKLTVDGDFGAATLAAVEAFQKASKLTVDGIVGPATWAALEKAPAPKPKPVSEPELKQGSTGTAVKLLQTLINGRPVVTGGEIKKLVVDGDFGPATATAVKDIQRNCKLTVDGIVGPATWATLGNYS